MRIDHFYLDREEMVCNWQVETLIEFCVFLHAFFSFDLPWLKLYPDHKTALKWEIRYSIHS